MDVRISQRFACLHNFQLLPRASTSTMDTGQPAPATMDQLVEELERLGQKADSKKLVELIGRDEKLRIEGALTLDPTKMNPDVFVGLLKDIEYRRSLRGWGSTRVQ